MSGFSMANNEQQKTNNLYAKANDLSAFIDYQEG